MHGSDILENLFQRTTNLLVVRVNRLLESLAILSSLIYGFTHSLLILLTLFRDIKPYRNYHNLAQK